MSLFENYYFRVFYLVFVLVIAGAASNIHSDYYWRSQNELRSQKYTCDQTIMNIICFDQCGKNYACENDKCICNDGNQLKTVQRASDDYPFYQDNQYLYSKEIDMPLLLRAAIEEDTKAEETSPDGSKLENFQFDVAVLGAGTDQPEFPALRHHIAHFCPNLKKARTCIRKCMKSGKPGFCGKDHVCYCGHRYTSHDLNKKIDKKQVNMEFRDIYEKYFGPKIFEQTDYSEEA